MPLTLSFTRATRRPLSLGAVLQNAINGLRGLDTEQRYLNGRSALIAYSMESRNTGRDATNWRGTFLLRCYDTLHDQRDANMAENKNLAAVSHNTDLALDKRSLVSARLFALRRIHNLSHEEIGLLLMRPAEIVCAWEMGQQVISEEEASQVAELEHLIASQYANATFAAALNEYDDQVNPQAFVRVVADRAD